MHLSLRGLRLPDFHCFRLSGLLSRLSPRLYNEVNICVEPYLECATKGRARRNIQWVCSLWSDDPEFVFGLEIHHLQYSIIPLAQTKFAYFRDPKWPLHFHYPNGYWMTGCLISVGSQSGQCGCQHFRCGFLFPSFSHFHALLCFCWAEPFWLIFIAFCWFEISLKVGSFR